MEKRKQNGKYVTHGLCIVLGWWSGLIALEYLGRSSLWALAIFGIMLVFLGFIYYYGKANNVPTKKTGSSKKESGSLLTKSRIWNR